MVGSVLNEGARGLQTAQREIGKAAQDIARANITTNPNSQATNAVDEVTTIPPVDELQNSSRQGGIEEPLIELRRQEQIFNANAKVISVADETLGSLIDVQS